MAEAQNITVELATPPEGTFDKAEHYAKNAAVIAGVALGAFIVYKLWHSLTLVGSITGHAVGIAEEGLSAVDTALDFIEEFPKDPGLAGAHLGAKLLDKFGDWFGWNDPPHPKPGPYSYEGNRKKIICTFYDQGEAICFAMVLCEVLGGGTRGFLLASGMVMGGEAKEPELNWENNPWTWYSTWGTPPARFKIDEPLVPSDVTTGRGPYVLKGTDFIPWQEQTQYVALVRQVVNDPRVKQRLMNLTIFDRIKSDPTLYMIFGRLNSK